VSNATFCLVLFFPRVLGDEFQVFIQVTNVQIREDCRAWQDLAVQGLHSVTMSRAGRKTGERREPSSAARRRIRGQDEMSCP